MIALINLVCQSLYMPGVNIEDLAESGMPIVIVRRRVEGDSEVVIYRPIMRRVLGNNEWVRIITQVSEYYDCKVLVNTGKDQVLECQPV